MAPKKRSRTTHGVGTFSQAQQQVSKQSAMHGIEVTLLTYLV